MLFDGLEITQFTYFQQAGGIELAPISVELTYGLERFAMALQDVDNVYDLEWAPGVKYRDVRQRDEVEQSKYAFGQVDMPAARVRTRSTATCSTSTTGSSQTLLRAGLVLPALEYCLKCSHLFNILDASGSIGVTERTAYILRVRQLAVGDRESLRGPATTRAAREAAAERNGSRTPARNRRRRAAGRLAAGADAASSASVVGAQLTRAPARRRSRRSRPSARRAA